MTTRNIEELPVDIVQRLRVTRATLIEHSPQDRAVRDAMTEIDRLQRRELIWAASGRWCHDWITRATNLLGELRDELEHEIIVSGHMVELEQLLADDFEDGDTDER